MLKLLVAVAGLLVLILPLRADEPSVTLAAVGDVMLSRTVPQHIAAHDADWAWAAIAPQLKQADLRFCNLECPITAGGRAIPKRYSFRADKDFAAQILAAGGINIASLANNHTYDYGSNGLADTLTAIDKLKINGIGAGIGRAQAVTPRIITVNGLKLAFLAYTNWTPESYLPTDDRACLAIVDEATFADEIRVAKAQADLLILSMHWGQEYARAATPEQERLAKLAIDAGADLILGHHPHVAQPIEIYRDRPIIYSLGNCLFDRTDTRHSNGLLVLLRLQKGKVTLEQQLPLKIEEARPLPNTAPTDIQ